VKAAAVPKRITNAQTVCNQKNEKGKLCNGHLKQLRTAASPSRCNLVATTCFSKCQTCGTSTWGRRSVTCAIHRAAAVR